jgi:hypothetical protein
MVASVGEEEKKPVWAVSYKIRGFDTDGMLKGWRWAGHVSSDVYVLEAASDGEPEDILGTATVMSTEPNRRDALADTLRSVRDLCAVAGAAIGGIGAEPVLPELEIKHLDGAKSTGGVAITDSVSFKLTQQLKHDGWFSALGLLANDPTLRANLDTFDIAKRQADSAARLVNLFRIYDSYAREVLEDEGRLLEADVRDAMVSVAMEALETSELTSSDMARIRSSMESNLARILRRSRLDILEEHFDGQDFTELGIGREFLGKLDKLRGKAAHNPTELEAFAEHADDLAKLFGLVHRLLRLKLGLWIPPDHD